LKIGGHIYILLIENYFGDYSEHFSFSYYERASSEETAGYDDISFIIV